MISRSDKRLVKNLVSHFEKHGVIEREDDFFSPDVDVDEILTEAYEVAKFEKDLNPDFYDEELEEEMSERFESAENPLVENY